MSLKFGLIIYYLLPFAMFGQTVVKPYYPLAESAPVRLVYYPENNVFTPGKLHFPSGWNFVCNSNEHNSSFLAFGDPGKSDGEWFPHYGDDYSRPLTGKETFDQPVYSEPLSLTSMIRPAEDKMGASASGGVVYTGGDDVFAYAHYGRTGKLIWRTSPIANNMMATRWALANFNIFRRTSSPSIRVN